MNMKAKTKKPNTTALRAIVGGLLLSPLSSNEIKNFAQDLDLEFLANLRELLFSLNLPSDNENSALPSEPGEDMGELILSLAKGRRLSKSRIYEYMHEVDASLAKLVISPEKTLRESVRQFVGRSGPEIAARLLGRIQGMVEQDPYLTGISKNR